MKEIRFNISLYIIIPLIFAGIALLSTIVAYHITGHYLRNGMDPQWPVAFWAVVMMALTFISGFLIAKMLLGPLERFVKNTEKLGILRKTDEEKRATKKDDMERFALVFDQVTELLSRVESRKLFPQIIGQSAPMRGVLNQIMKVAPTDSTVLILGETGTGKELIANSIYEHSPRYGKPFVPINCAAIPRELLESELFGHEKGAFTGAAARKPGKLEIADGGTIFLDEVSEMPLEIQAKILRVIEHAEVERVGGTHPIKVNVRFIAATNRDLSKMVDAGKFRQDLFFRLHVFPIHVPPLRDRKEDIPLLVQAFLKQLKKNVDISPETMQLLTAYEWPGNVRELQNAIEAASVMATDVIKPIHLPSTITKKWGNAAKENLGLLTNQNLDLRLRELEKGLIIEALTKTGGVQIRAARLLGIKERSLWHRIKKLGIDVSSFKENID
ncbi:MAG: sigma-54-dependent Fis family transcriptional regulator [Deltaproteobacteria bacterium]|nr:MAG: sigma-54-dependent Fis family transcriptional regulator [Deltaproteobacteria bacterium]